MPQRWFPPNENEVQEALDGLPQGDILHTESITLLDSRLLRPLGPLEFTEARVVKALMVFPLFHQNERVERNEAVRWFVDYWRPFFNQWVGFSGGKLVPATTFKKWAMDGIDTLLRMGAVNYYSPNRLKLELDELDLRYLNVCCTMMALDRDRKPLTFPPKSCIDKALIKAKPGITGYEVIEQLKGRCESLHITKGQWYFIDTHRKIVMLHGKNGTGSIYVEGGEEIEDLMEARHYRSIDRLYYSLERLLSESGEWPERSIQFVLDHGIATRKMLELLYPEEESKLQRLSMFRQHHARSGDRSIMSMGPLGAEIFLSPDLRFRMELRYLLTKGDIKMPVTEVVDTMTSILQLCEFPERELGAIIDNAVSYLRRDGELSEDTASLLVTKIHEVIEKLEDDRACRRGGYIENVILRAVERVGLIERPSGLSTYQVKPGAEGRIKALHRLLQHISFEL